MILIVFSCNIQNLVFWQEIEPLPLPLGMPHLNHWTTSEVPRVTVISRKTHGIRLFQCFSTFSMNQNYQKIFFKAYLYPNLKVQIQLVPHGMQHFLKFHGWFKCTVRIKNHWYRYFHAYKNSNYIKCLTSIRGYIF